MGVKAEVGVFNSIVAACAHSGEHGQARAVFDAMPSHGCRPDAVTFANLIRAYKKAIPPPPLETAPSRRHSMLAQGSSGKPVDLPHWVAGSGEARPRSRRKPLQARGRAWTALDCRKGLVASWSDCFLSCRVRSPTWDCILHGGLQLSQHAMPGAVITLCSP